MRLGELLQSIALPGDPLQDAMAESQSKKSDERAVQRKNSMQVLCSLGLASGTHESFVIMVTCWLRETYTTVHQRLGHRQAYIQAK